MEKSILNAVKEDAGGGKKVITEIQTASSQGDG